jgi:hypothetical protein
VFFRLGHLNHTDVWTTAYTSPFNLGERRVVLARTAVRMLWRQQAEDVWLWDDQSCGDSWQDEVVFDV